jgi:hypothetical protein
MKNARRLRESKPVSEDFPVAESFSRDAAGWADWADSGRRGQTANAI